MGEVVFVLSISFCLALPQGIGMTKGCWDGWALLRQVRFDALHHGIEGQWGFELLMKE